MMAVWVSSPADMNNDTLIYDMNVCWLSAMRLRRREEPGFRFARGGRTQTDSIQANGRILSWNAFKSATFSKIRTSNAAITASPAETSKAAPATATPFPARFLFVQLRQE
jgi:hypothetical protein